LKGKKKPSVFDSTGEKDTHDTLRSDSKQNDREPTSINETGFDPNSTNEDKHPIGKGRKVAEKVEGVGVIPIPPKSVSPDEGPLDNKGDYPSREDFLIYLAPANDAESSIRCDNRSNNRSRSTHDPDKLDPEDYVRQLETKVGERLSTKRRAIMKHIASINLGRGIGATRIDLEKIGIRKDNAEKILRQLREDQFLVLHHKKTGRLHAYALPNLVHLMPGSVEDRKREDQFPFDVTLMLAAKLTKTHYGYHNIGLETSLNYIEDYDILDWPIKSQKNKQKVKAFRLDKTRTCIFKVSPTSTLEIDFQSTSAEYFFHTSQGVLELFEDCGESRGILKLEANNRMEIVPRISEWTITHFDYSKNLQTRRLQSNYPNEMMSWRGRGVLKLKYLATLFQIYQKPMPFIGDCLRVEGHKSIKGGIKMSEMLERIIRAESDNSGQAKHPFTTLEEMLLSGTAKVID
jgi:hypothetical protein